MGATQSKKRRKERKRKRRQQYGGPSSAHFDVPRSVSLDALRSHGVTSPSSAAAGCPHCGGWSWGHPGRTGERRTFSGLLESSGVCHGFHRCLRGQYDDMQGSGSQLRGYDSEDDAGRWSYHLSCPACSVGMSEEDMASNPSMRLETSACPGPEHSTMSLNRHMGLRVNSKIPQSRSSEFSELLSILRRHEEMRNRQGDSAPVSPVDNTASLPLGPRIPTSASSPSSGTASFPDQSNRVAISCTALNTMEAPAMVPSNTKSPTPPPTQVMVQSEPSPGDNKITSLPTISLSTATATTATSSTTADITETTTTAPKKPITVLEDEETRLARWEKQKLMAEQFRLLRKHLLAREASLKASEDSAVSEPLPLSLKGPLDAVESYLSSQSNSNSSLKSAGLSSSLSNTGSVQSLPNPSPEGSQVSSQVQHIQSALLHPPLQCSVKRSRQTGEAEEGNTSERSSSFTFSSSIHCKTVKTTSSSATVDKTNLSLSQQTHSLVHAASQSQTSHGRSKFARHGQNFRNLDNHPVLSRLQNEQNSRLERMERKMRCIRASAEQAAERKKFEQIFPARQEVLVEDERQRMKEAEESLVKLKEENKRIKQMKKASVKENLSTGDTKQHKIPVVGQTVTLPSSSACTDSKAKDSRSMDDSGEVIPVHVLPAHASETNSSGSLRRESSMIKAKEDNGEEETNQPQEMGKKPHWLNSTFSKINMDLGNPLSWLVLPFLLFPLILRLLLSMALNTKPQPTGPASHSPTPTSSPSSSRRDESSVATRGTNQEDCTAVSGQTSPSSDMKIVHRRCESKIRLQRGDSTETKRLQST